MYLHKFNDVPVQSVWGGPWKRYTGFFRAVDVG